MGVRRIGASILSGDEWIFPRLAVVPMTYGMVSCSLSVSDYPRRTISSRRSTVPLRPTWRSCTSTARLATARYAIAAVLFFRTQLRSSAMQTLPQVKESLAGWQKLCPPRSRLPVPYEVVMLLAATALAQRFWEICIYLLLTFALYLRPSEGLRLRKKDFVPPRRHAKGTSGGQLYSILKRWAWHQRPKSTTNVCSWIFLISKGGERRPRRS